MKHSFDFQVRLDRRQIKIVTRGVQDRRRHRRVPLSLLARGYALDTNEFVCKIIDVSPGGACIMSSINPELGERTILMADSLGRVEGIVARLGKGWFGLNFNATQRKRDRLGDAITWRYNMRLLGLEEDRVAVRKPGQGRTFIELRDGVMLQPEIIDVSSTGAAFSCQERPRVGESVKVGGMSATVTRWLNDGFAVHFKTD